MTHSQHQTQASAAGDEKAYQNTVQNRLVQNQAQRQRELDLQYLSQALDLARLSPPKPTNFRVGCVIVASLTGTFGGNTEPQTQKQPRVLSTGYTLELPGNTHAEQCALAKLAAKHNLPEERVCECPEFSGWTLGPEPDSRAEADTEAQRAGVIVTLYTSLEPCAKRLSGNKSCVERILATRSSSGGSGAPSTTGSGVRGIHRIVYGAKEPDTFVQKSTATKILEEAGIQVDYVGDLQAEILRVAMEGHQNQDQEGQRSNIMERGSGSVTQSQENEQGQGQGQSQAQPRATGTNIDDISPEERRRQEALPRNPKKRMMEVDVPPRS
ncbi:hypothetical protein ABEF95_016739 [Exophiala dermatitidis]